MNLRPDRPAAARDPAGHAAQGCERQAAQGQEAGESRELMASRHFKAHVRKTDALIAGSAINISSSQEERVY